LVELGIAIDVWDGARVKVGKTVDVSNGAEIDFGELEAIDCPQPVEKAITINKNNLSVFCVKCLFIIFLFQKSDFKAFQSSSADLAHSVASAQ
jgi:hypothetical protein